VELRHIRYFVAVAEELHFRRAAERLHVAQPAVSEQIRKLEDELGVRLLNRSQRSVSVTDAGAAFLVEARRVVQQAEQARQAARNARNGAHARLRIGYVPASLPASVSSAVQRLGEAMANLQTTLVPGSGLELLDAVRAAELDAAIVSLPAPTKGLRLTSLGVQRVVAALPVGHPASDDPPLRLEAIAGGPIVVLRRDANPPFYDAVLSVCRAAGASPQLFEISDGDVERLLLAVAAGAGVGLVPDSMRERYVASGVRFVALDTDNEPSVPSVVATRTDSTHMPTAAFLRAASETARSLAVLEPETTRTAVA
jgi:DNA-binding transcriptional LysR family regulator